VALWRQRIQKFSHCTSPIPLTDQPVSSNSVSLPPFSGNGISHEPWFSFKIFLGCPAFLRAVIPSQISDRRQMPIPSLPSDNRSCGSSSIFQSRFPRFRQIRTLSPLIPVPSRRTSNPSSFLPASPILLSQRSRELFKITSIFSLSQRPLNLTFLRIRA